MQQTAPATEQAAEQPAAAVEEGKSTEPVADAALVSVGSTVYTLLALSVAVLFVVAVPIDWYNFKTVGAGAPGTTAYASAASTDVGLFATETTTVSPPTTVTSYVGQWTCDELRKRFRAISAFAIISVLLGGAMLVVGIAARLSSRWPACPLTGLPPAARTATRR